MPYRTFLFLGGSVALAVVLLAMVTGFVPKNMGTEMRRQASFTVVTLRPEDMPQDIISQGDGKRLWAVRAPVARPGGHAEPTTADTDKNARVAPTSGIVGFAREGVMLFIGGQSLLFTSDAQGELAPLLPWDGVSLEGLLVNQSRQYGDALDGAGHPLRWRAGGDSLTAQVAVSPGQSLALLRRAMERHTVEAIVVHERPRVGSAGQFRDLVREYAAQYHLNEALIYAIIHNESHFTTHLVSPRSAIGLMQVLPGTASGEVHRFLHGRSGAVGLASLQDPATNIRYGTAYLHLLHTRYFGSVQNPQSREYCAVAAYNMGPNRLLRFYGPTRDQALARINAMSSDELYNDLIARLPARETRVYVARVRQMKTQYAAAP